MTKEARMTNDESVSATATSQHHSCLVLRHSFVIRASCFAALCASTLAEEPGPVFVAAGHFGARMISEDGVHWSKPVLGKEGETYRFLQFLGGRCVAVGSFGGDNIMASTVDGKTWKTAKHDAKYVNYVRCLTVGKGVFLGIAGDAGGGGIAGMCKVTTSTDGTKWSEQTSIEGKAMLRRAVFGKDRFVAVGDLGRRAVSTDGKKWRDAPGVKALDTLIDVAYGNDVFVGVGLHGLRMRSADGLVWTDRQIGEEGVHLNSVLWTGDRFVAIGQGATYFSKDGSQWTHEKNADAPTIATYGNGIFVGSKWRGRLLMSRDGIQWRETMKSEQPIESLAFGTLSK
jgi:hypothetical protein